MLISLQSTFLIYYAKLLITWGKWHDYCTGICLFMSHKFKIGFSVLVFLTFCIEIYEPFYFVNAEAIVGSVQLDICCYLLLHLSGQTCSKYSQHNTLHEGFCSQNYQSTKTFKMFMIPYLSGACGHGLCLPACYRIIFDTWGFRVVLYLFTYILTRKDLTLTVACTSYC